MANKIRTKMPVSQRAKQFAPFQAVGGLDTALRKKEEEHRRQIEAEIQMVIDPEDNVVINIDDNGDGQAE